MTTKRAEEPLPTMPVAISQMQNEGVQNDALSTIIRAGLASLAVGGGAAGLKGLHSLWQHDDQPPNPQNDAMPLPYPVIQRKKPQPGMQPPLKIASVLQVFQKRAQPEPQVQPPTPPAAEPGTFSADSARSMPGVPWFDIGLLGAVGAGGLGGYKAVNSLINWRRQSDREAEIEQEKKKFHDALMAQYDKPIKIAHESEGTQAGLAIDRLFLALEKQASVKQGGDPISGGQALVGAVFDPENWRRVAGAYWPYAALSAGIAGTAMYDKVRKGSQQALLDEAIRRRDLQRYRNQPSDLFAVPEPVPVGA